MTHPAITARNAARGYGYLLGLALDAIDDLRQDVALDALERFDPSRAAAKTFGRRAASWRRADAQRRFETANRLAPAVSHEAPRVETPEEQVAREEEVRLVRALAERFDPADLELVLDERPLRVRARAEGVAESTVWRRREAVRARMRDAAREVGL